MRNVEIIGYGYYVPETTVQFEDQTRHRVIKDGEETQLTMAVKACKKALDKAGVGIEDIDLILSASAVDMQPIPCNAALIHEQIAKGLDIPAMDINTTCTSFISALDVISYLIDAGRYSKVLLVASEDTSSGLNPLQKESFELFADGAAAAVLTKSNGEAGIIAAMQKTWSEGAHSTEIRGGLTLYPPEKYDEETASDFMFDMKGLKVLSLAGKKLPKMVADFEKETGIAIADVDMIVPHQASRALKLIMKKLNIPEGKYIDLVKDYGNMVSVAIPFAFFKSIDDGKIKKGDKVMLIGTAAGLTGNILVMKY